MGAIRMKQVILASVSLLVLGGVASAADMRMPVKAPPPVVEAAPSWTGLYLGAHVGYGWGDSDTTIVTPSGTFPAGFALDTSHPKGVLGGGQVGVNYQIGQFVFGLEGDGSWGDIHGGETTLSPLVAGRTTLSNTRIDWLAMATGRAGLAFQNVLLYVKGGWAWGGFKGDSVTNTATGALVANTVGSETRDGWTFGGGIEWMIIPSWSVKAEYNFVDFGTDRVQRLTTTGVTAGTILDRDVKTQLNIVKVGVNYHFNWAGPVAARY